MTWRTNMEQIDQKLKLKIVLIIFISNILIFLIFSQDGSAPTEDTKDYTNYREGFVKLKLQGMLHTDFEYNKPITIINKSRTIIIRHAILLEQMNNTDSTDGDLLLPGTVKKDRVSIYVHKKHVPTLISLSHPIIVPFDSVLPTKRNKRRNYEILL
jgi:hypothetical protein